MIKLKINILNPVECSVDKASIPLISPCLSYESVFWKPGRYRRERKVYQADFVSRKGRFLTGFLPKINDYCASNDIEVTISGEIEKLETCQPYYPKFFWDKYDHDQLQVQLSLVQKAIDCGRGIVKAATGVGKTNIMMGIVLAYPTARVLILAHTHTIISQITKAVAEIGEEERVEVATVQAFFHKDPREYWNKYDIVFIDECHHVSNPKGSYAGVLQHSSAPVRLGFTGTLPPEKRAQLTMEGNLGPVIGELTIQEAGKMGILSTPKIEWIRVPFNAKVKGLRKYPDVYDQGVVNSKSFNRLVAKRAVQAIKEGKTVLILVIQIEHGRNIVAAAKRLYNVDLEFVYGDIDKEVRDEIQLSLSTKKVKGVVASAVFREGLDVPSLDVVINACEAKAELLTLQAVGRGLRRTDEKKHVTIVDFFNPSHHFLIDHFGERICLYMDNGWL